LTISSVPNSTFRYRYTLGGDGVGVDGSDGLERDGYRTARLGTIDLVVNDTVTRWANLPAGREPGPGTRVRVIHVDFPTPGSLVGRPLLTPRYNPWVKVLVNKFDLPPGTPFEDIPHVMVLPLGVADPEDAVRLITQLLGGEDVRQWMNQRSAEVKKAVAHKEVTASMTLDEVIAALGEPDDIEKDFGAEGRKETLHWGARSVTLVENAVVLGPASP
jgi:hypothetical protein